MRTCTRAHAHARVRAQEGVEDTKGNNGMVGELAITNLRLIWVGSRKTTNLTVGLGTVTAVNIRTASSRLKGERPASPNPLPSLAP